MGERFSNLWAVERSSVELPSTQAQVAAVKAAYVRDFSREQHPQAIRALSNGDLRLLFRAARDVAFYTMETAAAQAVAQDVQAMEQRHIVRKEDYFDLYRAYVGARMLQAAGALAQHHPVQGMVRIPALQKAKRDSLTPWAWRVDPQAYALRVTPIDLRGSHIVIVAHPLCHFSRNAANALARDAQLGPLFERYGRWLAPAGQSFEVVLFQRWNARHPKQQMLLANRMRDWPMLDQWATPTFYFIKDGRVQTQVQGWPREGRQAELLAAARKLGLSLNLSQRGVTAAR